MDKQFRYQTLKFHYEKKLGYGYGNNKTVVTNLIKMQKVTTLIIMVILNLACKNTINLEMKTKDMLEHIEVRELNTNHWLTYTDIVIDAPIEKVWQVLTDWNNISNWSSSLVGINGNTHNNGKVMISYLVDGKTYNTPHVFIYKDMEEFGWSDRMEGSFAGLTDNHRFRVEKISDIQTRFIQSDDFKGIGNKDMSAEQIAKITVEFFPIFNRELKIEVEN
ncbi:SRPBCC family protein [Winogradskyella helgolandensis]|uniref:SRPBCC family protein n=1 Tax=Winogradskyella helgolandensis TaxID=2697010 RepID=UPI0015CDEA59|nr:hypothetical protein [Winogradskyella helgolandensis]